jgi:ubiquinone/menaquinone biosynthesis C-methylase UbiE
VRALRELRRVLRPEGRLVVGEVVLDPDCVPERKLARLAAEAGFVSERKQGPRWSFLTRLRPAGATA